MKKLLICSSIVFGILAVTALDAAAQTVSGRIGNGTIRRGVATRATVTLSIPGGLHVNSNRPGSEYSIPTTVRATAAGVRISAVSYPRGKRKSFSFSQTPINIYDGSPTFTFNVTVPQSYKKYSVVVNVTVRYQACTDEVCYAPKTKTARLTASVL
ncbi:MAG TPA: protein-disulfide reductase DsbD family protein [Pyrinomonadaceae bacterium]|nr:protein-disulfide reductase DsbD family protein [Pyrinomonadaceae bacterium]